MSSNKELHEFIGSWMNVSIFKIFTKLPFEGGKEMSKIKWIPSSSIITIGILKIQTLEKNYY